MPIFDAVTILDGEASLAEKPPRDAHLEQSRWLVRWADLVVVIWNGKLAAGTGGTADTVALALGKGLPVVWIDESNASMPIRFLSPERLWLDAYFPEIVDALVHPDRREVQAPVASARALAEFLIPVFLPPSSLTKLEGPCLRHCGSSLVIWLRGSARVISLSSAMPNHIAGRHG